MSDTPKDEEYSEQETERRREAGLKKLLAMPPQPHRPKAGEAALPDKKPRRKRQGLKASDED
jgi:hypothetical protein